MASIKISPERWQGMYGPVPQDFSLMVQETLKKTREAPAMKRFTLRTALVAVICLLLLTGIALAASGVFSTKNSLDMYTSAPTDGAGVDMQTDLHQAGGDFPDLTVKVRDAVFDGVTAFVTVEYRLKHPEKDMILSHWDTYGMPRRDVGRWPGYSTVPLNDPQKDPRRKLVIYDDGADVYGLYNYSLTDHIYESDGVLVLTWRVRMDSDRLFNPGYSWENKTSVQDETKAAQDRETIENVLQKIAGPELLELTLVAECQEWDGDVKTPGKGLYFCNAGVSLQKGPAPVIRYSQAPVTQGEITLANASVTFTKLATYMDIRTKYPLASDDWSDSSELANSLAFRWLDKDRNVIPELGGSMSGAYDWEDVDYTRYEKNQYSAFWPAAEQIPDAITLQAYRVDTEERLATFTVPLSPVQEDSPIPSPSPIAKASPAPSP